MFFYPKSVSPSSRLSLQMLLSQAKNILIYKVAPSSLNPQPPTNLNNDSESTLSFLREDECYPPFYFIDPQLIAKQKAFITQVQDFQMKQKYS